MSRCTPNISGWTRRAKRYGGRAAIANIRAVQLQRLAQFAGYPQTPIRDLTPTEIAARDLIGFLEGSPVRVLNTHTTTVGIGWQDLKG